MPGIISFNPIEVINQMIAYTILIAALLTVIFIIFGGMMFITAGSNDDRIQQATNTIKYAIIGLVICILSFSIVYYIGQFFGYNFIDYLSIESIMETMEGIGDKFAQ